MLTIPMNYTELGGTYTMLTGSKVGQVVAGQRSIMACMDYRFK